MNRRNIGILGGSFNPVHIGHVLLADYLTQFAGLDEVWLMLSPQNPLKVSDGTRPAPDSARLEMLRLATDGCSNVHPCDIELTMPRPNYTIDSLSLLAARYPETDFCLVIGSDNWNIFNRWRDYRKIMDLFAPIVYPRPGYPVDTSALPSGITLVDAPVFDISSTFLRKAIAAGHDMRLFLPRGVWDYITTNRLYGYGNTTITTGA